MTDNRAVALVTGAASGIGRAAVERFLAAGWRVVAADLNAAAGKELLSDLSGSGGLEFARTDVSREEDVAAAVARATEAFGRIDCVVNNAGIGGAFGPITEIEVDDWDHTFAVLVRGVFLGIKHGARAMRAQGTGGAIVNTASIAALSGGAGPQAYSAAKAAVLNLGRSAAVELAADHIRVNTVCPGLIATPLLGRSEEQARPVLDQLQPWPEMGQPEQVANLIVFLASDEARFITGEAVTVDGGVTAAGPRLDDSLGGNPARRGLVGVNHGSTGVRSLVRRRLGGKGDGKEGRGT
ncbi:MAG: SDR family oxidoreductase [Streptosporangiales bacterium]|nr:SDR family oxidoreductase [Streptosporangiales bacterium]